MPPCSPAPGCTPHVEKTRIRPTQTSGAIHSERCSQNSRRMQHRKVVFMRPPSTARAVRGLHHGDEQVGDRGRAGFTERREFVLLAPVVEHGHAAEDFAFVEGLERARRVDVAGGGHELRETLAEGVHRRVQRDLAVLDEDDVGEDVFDLLDLVRGHEDGALLVEVVVQQVVVERAAEQQVEAERRLVEHQ